MKKVLLIISLLFAVNNFGQDTTVINTSFEASGTPAYNSGNINLQNLWTVSNSTGTIVTDTSYVHTGGQSLRLNAVNSILKVQHTAFGGTVSGITGIVYFDLYVKIKSSSTKEFTINGYDLFGGSSKRAFVVDFTVPVNDTGSVRIYNLANKVRLGLYNVNSWIRISGRVDYTNSTYQVCLNAGAVQSASFREAYTPTASGTRKAGVKEFHQLLFNIADNGTAGNVDAAIDDIYIGQTPIADVNFGGSNIQYTVSVTQPVAGTISLNPSGGTYTTGTSVTATLTLPSGYKNYGWSGALTGTALSGSFTVNGNLTLSSTVWIDSLNPPVQYTISVTQPSNALITVSPYYPQVYSGLKDTALRTIQPGYLLTGWTGSLSGTQQIKIFTVTGDMNIGAVVEIDTTPIPVGTRKTFSSASAFKTALASAIPGDTLELTNGIYNIGGCNITKSGTEQNRILIRAQNTGQVELNGTSYFTGKQVSYVTIEGFVFTSTDISTAIKTESCNYMRITGNIFRLTGTISNKWVLIGGTYNLTEPNSSHNRIDHNLFEEKHTLGNFITIDGSPAPNSKISQYDLIDHNHFRNMGPRAVNEMEAIRVGVSTMSNSSGFCTIEYNLFEDCDGDPEIISIKSWDNIVRYNTIRSCQGTICLRQGNRSTVEGNFILGNHKAGTGGIRLYSDNHKVFNNYIAGTMSDTWDAGITITSGDVDSGSTDMSAHFRPRRAKIVNNTFVDNLSNIELGYTNNGNYNKPPKDNVIANNIVLGSVNPLIIHHVAPLNHTYSGNIMYPSGTATLGITAVDSEIKVIDPMMVYSDSMMRLAPGSPARNASIGNYPFLIYDIEGQLREGIPDVGADQYSTSPVKLRPLSAEDVGPNGGNIALPVELTSFNASVKNRNVILNWTTASEINNSHFIIYRNNEKIAVVKATGNSNVIRRYSYTDSNIMSGYYSYKLYQVDTDGRGVFISSVDVNVNYPLTWSLEQNYPNPFNPATIIKYNAAKSGFVDLSIYNILGEKIKTLLSAFIEAGEHKLEFNASDLPSGVYVYRLNVENYSSTRKMMLIK